MILETANTILVASAAKSSFQNDCRLDKHSKVEYNTGMTNERLSRQVACIGEAKQKALSNATIAIVGLGGIGSVVAPMLAKMGVGQLILIDKAKVKVNNLSRQMYNESDVGESKVVVAVPKLRRINPDINLTMIKNGYATFSEAVDILKSVSWRKIDLILDCTDNAEVRWEIEDFCVRHNVAWIYASVVGYIGKVKTFLPKSKVRLDKFIKRPSNLPPLSTIQNKTDCPTVNPITVNPHEIGTIVPSVELVGTTQVSEALKIIWKECEDKEYMYNIASYPDVRTEKIELSL